MQSLLYGFSILITLIQLRYEVIQIVHNIIIYVKFNQGRRQGVCLEGGQNVSLLLREPKNFAPALKKSQRRGGGGGGGLRHIFFDFKNFSNKLS